VTVVQFKLSHIAESCPTTKLEGGLRSLHAAHKLVIDWLGARDVGLTCGGTVQTAA